MYLPNTNIACVHLRNADIQPYVIPLDKMHPSGLTMTVKVTIMRTSLFPDSSVGRATDC